MVKKLIVTCKKCLQTVTCKKLMLLVKSYYNFQKFNVTLKKLMQLAKSYYNL